MGNPKKHRSHLNSIWNRNKLANKDSYYPAHEWYVYLVDVYWIDWYDFASPMLWHVHSLMLCLIIIHIWENNFPISLWPLNFPSFFLLMRSFIKLSLVIFSFPSLLTVFIISCATFLDNLILNLFNLDFLQVILLRKSAYVDYCFTLLFLFRLHCYHHHWCQLPAWHFTKSITIHLTKKN